MLVYSMNMTACFSPTNVYGGAAVLPPSVDPATAGFQIAVFDRDGDRIYLDSPDCQANVSDPTVGPDVLYMLSAIEGTLGALTYINSTYGCDDTFGSFSGSYNGTNVDCPPFYTAPNHTIFTLTFWIVIASIGGFLLLCLVAFLIYLCVQRRKRLQGKAKKKQKKK